MTPKDPVEDEIDKTLKELVNTVEWCVQAPGAVPINRQREEEAVTSAAARLRKLMLKERQRETLILADLARCLGELRGLGHPIEHLEEKYALGTLIEGRSDE